jgi:hypothetical protein
VRASIHHLLEVLEWPTCVTAKEGLARFARDRIEIVSDRLVAAHTTFLVVHAAAWASAANVFSVHGHTGTAFVVATVQ